MRAGRHDLLRADLAEGLDVLLGEHLEEELVAGAAGRVTRAGLAVAQDREGHACGVEQLGHRSGRLLGPVLVGAGAADPEQVVDLGGVGDVLAQDLDLEGQVLGPVHPGPGRHAPRVLLVLEVLEQATELGRERRLDQDLVSPHVGEVVDVLDVDRALLDAGTAHRARPQGLLVDDRQLRVGGAVPVEGVAVVSGVLAAFT